MVEFRWCGRSLQFRERSFQVDASGAFCGVTEFGEWKEVSECVDIERAIEERDIAEDAADRMASVILGEPIDWQFHDDAWTRAVEKLESA